MLAMKRPSYTGAELNELISAVLDSEKVALNPEQRSLLKMLRSWVATTFGDPFNDTQLPYHVIDLESIITASTVEKMGEVLKHSGRYEWKFPVGKLEKAFAWDEHPEEASGVLIEALRRALTLVLAKKPLLQD